MSEFIVTKFHDVKSTILGPEDLTLRMKVADADENELGVAGLYTSMGYEPIIEFDDGVQIILDWESLSILAGEVKKRYEEGNFKYEYQNQ